MVYAKEKWFALMWNEVEKKQMVWDDNKRFNPLRAWHGILRRTAKYTNMKWNWNSPCGVWRQDLTSIENLARKQLFHLLFVHFGQFASADFLLQIFSALIKEFWRNAEGSIGKLIGAHAWAPDVNCSYDWSVYTRECIVCHDSWCGGVSTAWLASLIIGLFAVDTRTYLSLYLKVIWFWNEMIWWIGH